jgi:hypothetical protein
MTRKSKEKSVRIFDPLNGCFPRAVCMGEITTDQNTR